MNHPKQSRHQRQQKGSADDRPEDLPKDSLAAHRQLALEALDIRLRHVPDTVRKCIESLTDLEKLRIIIIRCNCQSILGTLDLRFGPIPDSLRTHINSIEDPDKIRSLLIASAHSDSLESFSSNL